VAHEINAAMDWTQPAVLDPTRDLVPRDATSDKLPARNAPLLAIRQRSDDGVRQSTAEFCWHIQQNPAVDRDAPLEEARRAS